MSNTKYSLEYVDGDTIQFYSSEDFSNFTAVEAGDYVVSQDSMLTEGVYNCIAIIGISDQNTGLLGHFQRISLPGTGSYEKFHEALEKLRAIGAHTVVLAGGGMFDNPADFETARPDRDYAERVTGAFLPAAEVVCAWNDAYNGRQDILAHPVSAHIVIYNATTAASI